MLARESGYALKLIAPGTEPRPEPPGQGQLLVGLRGSALLEETGGPEGRVVSTTRGASRTRISVGGVFRVANDARWSARAETEDSLLLALSTSVPRERQRSTDLLAQARGRLHMGSVRLFGNEVVQVDYLAARGRLPLRGWMPWRSSARGLEHFFVLQGAFRLRLRTLQSRGVPDEVDRGVLPLAEHHLVGGSLLRIPEGTDHQLSSRGGELAVGLVFSARRSLSSERVRREDVRGFTPFS